MVTAGGILPCSFIGVVNRCWSTRPHLKSPKQRKYPSSFSSEDERMYKSHDSTRQFDILAVAAELN